MPLQPLFPEPLSVAGNVATIRYRDRVKFVRRVVVTQAVVVSLVALAATFPPIMTPMTGLILFFGGLVAMSAVRALWPEGWFQVALSGAMLLPAMAGLACIMNSAQFHGFPLWVWMVPSLAAGIYAVCCGQDYSYIGQSLLGALASVIALVVAVILGWLGDSQAWVAVGFCIVWLTYLSYDMSMIVKRRRTGEEASAVIDLFRDQLNWVTYPFRVMAHWRKFRFL